MSAASPSSGPGPGRSPPTRTGTPNWTRIEHVTSAYPDRCFAFDQFGPLSIRPCHGACWARRKHPVRHPGVLAAQRRERARIRSERQQRWGRPRPEAA